MKKEKAYTGYAVVTKDILDDRAYKNGSFGISFNSPDLEKCKRYCYDGHIIVRTYRATLSRFLCLRLVTKYPRFGKSRRHSYPQYVDLGYIRIEWGKDYTNEYERTVVYQKDINADTD